MKNNHHKHHNYLTDIVKKSFLGHLPLHLINHITPHVVEHLIKHGVKIDEKSIDKKEKDD